MMHVPSTELLDTVLAIRSVLKPCGRLLLSLPASRSDVLEDDRDAFGRLFTPYTADEISLLFERFGFRPISRWETGDSLGRQGTSWVTLLLELQHQGIQRPIDQIETILNRDRKEATYKLALIRALAEIATQESRSAIWLADGMVGVPIARIVERWLYYYWPLISSSLSIPQSKAEAAGGKSIKFRDSLTALIHAFGGMGHHGGLSAWHLARTSGQLSPSLLALLRHAQRDIADAIRSGPVKYSGGALETGPVFSYDNSTRLVLMPAGIWRELSLLGHWILDAVIVRWAALTQHLAHRQGVTAADVLPLLLARPEADRATAIARSEFSRQGVSECTWSGRRLTSSYAVDHIIPFSLWGNNDLWNLVPTDPKVNLSKSDKLPTSALLYARKPLIIQSWKLLRDKLPAGFDVQAEHLTGNRLPTHGGWHENLFSRLREAIEMTAAQRGVERWAPPG